MTKRRHCDLCGGEIRSGMATCVCDADAKAVRKLQRDPEAFRSLLLETQHRLRVLRKSVGSSSESRRQGIQEAYLSAAIAMCEAVFATRKPK